MTEQRRSRALSGVRGRVVLTVLLVTACLYSLLGSIGFLYIADSGRNSIRERVSSVLDQLEVRLRGGSGAISITTPDGVEAVAVQRGSSPFPASNDVTVRRTVTIGTTRLDLVGHASQARLTESLHSLHRGLWVGVPLGVLATAFVASLAMRRALRPVSVITDLAATVQAGDAEARVPVPATDDEIEHLARTVNDMLDRIAAGRAAQRQFTSDAAHELRTPLMALQGEIELALRDSQSANVAFLHRLEALGDRLARRVDDLVLLSTLDEQPPLDVCSADLLEIVRDETATARGPEGSAVAVFGGTTIASVDERLVARAVRNLIVNACRHAVHAVRVEVGSSDGHAWLRVEDDGPGVAEEDRAMVLSRFGRLDTARNADSGGAGLGLAIVSSVAHAHGGTVVIDDSTLGGARIAIVLPCSAST